MNMNNVNVERIWTVENKNGRILPRFLNSREEARTYARERNKAAPEQAPFRIVCFDRRA